MKHYKNTPHSFIHILPFLTSVPNALQKSYHEAQLCTKAPAFQLMKVAAFWCKTFCQIRLTVLHLYNVTAHERLVTAYIQCPLYAASAYHWNCLLYNMGKYTKTRHGAKYSGNKIIHLQKFCTSFI